MSVSDFIPPNATYMEIVFFCLLGFLCFIAFFMAVATFHSELERRRALLDWEEQQRRKEHPDA